MPGAAVQSCSRLVRLQHRERHGDRPPTLQLPVLPGPCLRTLPRPLHPRLWHLGLRPDALGFPQPRGPLPGFLLGFSAPFFFPGAELVKVAIALPVSRSSEASQHQGLAHPAPPRPFPLPTGHSLACVQPACSSGLASVVHLGALPTLPSPQPPACWGSGSGPPEGSSSQTGTRPSRGRAQRLLPCPGQPVADPPRSILTPPGPPPG